MDQLFGFLQTPHRANRARATQAAVDGICPGLFCCFELLGRFGVPFLSEESLTIVKLCNRVFIECR